MAFSVEIYLLLYFNGEAVELASLNTFLSPYYAPILAGLLAFQVVLILWLLHNHGEIRRLNGRIRRLAETGEGQDLAEVLERFHDLGEVRKVLDQLQERVADLRVGFEGCLSRMGLVRFNAFPDTGSDLSFALALLTHEGNGFILTSLYARDETRIFIKPVQDGRSRYRLSEEEEKALAMALGLLTPEKAAS
ncbi:hypothetical protein MOTHE_c25960 [Moorella thermoacetica]|uniref:DUF4446 domain-containing protein n=2 Tax=Neomoorella thermoacetica TaxID=1525 RepID=A0A1D7XF00_NEOTH|nr:hypothetical protein MOTHE_c25960 [Moorella thermoacetica]GAF25748.1 predicted transcriptional regulator [Moorella thermoacetica Y72]AKX97995.1 hypothetical protein MOTHA_c26670 [Moorella thermoacetica]AOQ25483.1 hypothetical protein Maut_03079 [Moorella thermoacetica]APC09708.1 hypothetical protein MTJW_25670 [Moorella thermoacetica]